MDVQMAAMQIQVGADDMVPNATAAAAVDQHSETISTDRLAKMVIRIREAKSAHVKEDDAFVKATYDDPLKVINSELARRMQEQGVTGFKTPFGTVYQAESMRVSGSDWTAFGEFLKTHDPLEYMEKRISSTAVKAYMTANDGAVPPGVNVFREFEARVRRPTEQ
jgi:hypothetical protein